MFLENLYEDDYFNRYLVMLANKNMLEFDDFKQDVFLDITETSCGNKHKCELIADKIAKRIKRYNIKHYSYSLDENRDSYSEDSISPLWEDNNILGVS